MTSRLLLGVSAIWLTGAILSPVQTPRPAVPEPAPLDFSRDVLPILSDKCFACHGPDAGTRMAGLRLDTPEGAFAARGEGRWAIVPHQPEKSLILARINDKANPMPPKSMGKPLTAKETLTLRRWIREGAKYGRLWSFEPLPREVRVPRTRSAWPRQELDFFVLDRLNREKLRPSREASRQRWLRRVTLDLTGLPPTPEERTAFLADTSATAYETVADRLLASPRYGERMAADWLDAARYGDSYGYQSDLLMPMWPYRDWVVRSFNRNQAYSDFIIDQIAGDLRPNATREQRLATAFNRLHRQSNEGGSIPLEFKTEYAVDRADTYGTSMLGLTLACARCHDHKFDPISQREFFQFFAYFNSLNEFGLLLSTEIVPTPSLLLPTPDQERALAEAKRKDDEARALLVSARAKAQLGGPGLQNLVRLSLDDEIKPENRIGNPEVVDGAKGKAVRLDGENGIVLRGLPAKERHEPFSWSFWLNRPDYAKPVVVLHRTGGTDVGFCGFDLLLDDGKLTARVMRHWPGNAVAVRTRTAIPKGKWTQVGWTWDGTGSASGLRLYIDGQPAATEVVANTLWKKIDAYGDHGSSGGEWSFGQRFRDLGLKGAQIDEIAFSPNVLTPSEMAVLGGKASASTAEDPAVVAAADRVRTTQRKLTAAEEPIQEISVMADTPTPEPAYVLARGAYDAPRTPENRVVRGTPAALPAMVAGKRNDRLSLAAWTVSPNHPLTARVAVNRSWQKLFGTGLVETSENFGIQGSRPSHPELLDYLARDFVNSGWNTKALLRKIVLSATYRQDSRLTPQLRQVDPLNRLLARGPAHRLPAEMLRDTALFGSGLLVEKVGGPPVNPYQPAGIWQEFNTMSPGFVQSTGEGLYRRSLYSTWKRTTPVPSMMLFDSNSREACSVRRPSTNTPLQALVLLNDIQYVEAARVLAERAHREGGVTRAFELVASREPDAAERAVLAQTLEEQRRVFRATPDEAKKLIAMGERKADPGIDPVELAAMTVTCQMILNSDAVVWKR